MQVRWVDQTQYPMNVVASLSAVPQSCRTPLPNQYLDCMLLAVYTHTHKLTHHHPSITLILPLPFLLLYAQSKSREVGNMWGYPVL